MKKIFYIFLTLFCYSNLFGQITIDSFNIYQTNNSVDSVSISGTNGGQVLQNISLIPSNDMCGTTVIVLNFNDCAAIPVTTFDTHFTLGFYTNRISIISKLDTSANCPYPIVPIYTDTAIWDNCTTFTANLIDEKQVKIYPNPARGILKIETSQGIRPRKIQLISLSGTVVKSFEPDARLLDIQSIPSGFYFLKIETEKGYFLIRKVIIE